MIVGKVNANYEPIIRLDICNIDNEQVYEQPAIVDTGFNGWLSLPPNFIAVLNLPWKRRGRATLGDSSECIFDVYEATIIWDKQRVVIPIDAAESEPLVGMSLMAGYTLTVEAIEGGLVQIEKL